MSSCSTFSPEKPLCLKLEPESMFSSRTIDVSPDM
eukprot:COSAG04_NODE_3900_length_2438_cov_1.339034_1_plen_34_part_10